MTFTNSPETEICNPWISKSVGQMVVWDESEYYKHIYDVPANMQSCG